MIEMRKQLSLMKRKVSEMDISTPADHIPSQLGGGAAPTAMTNSDMNEMAEREETPEQPNIDNAEV